MIGIDIIDIERFRKISLEDFLNWSKFFTRQEWDYCFLNSSDSARTLAGVFAAKEAIMKAVNGDLMKQFGRIQIDHERGGKPIVRIDNLKQRDVYISISHNNETVVAIALVYGKE